MVGTIPLWIALLVVTLRYAVGPAWRAHRPIWLRTFAAEGDALPAGAQDQESGRASGLGGGRGSPKAWTVWTAALVGLGLVGVVMDVLGVVVVRAGLGSMHAVWVLPSVSLIWVTEVKGVGC